jgi:hypothetical protein
VAQNNALTRTTNEAVQVPYTPQFENGTLVPPVVLDSAAVEALVTSLVNAKLAMLVQADKDLDANIKDVAHTTAVALGAKDPITGKTPSGKEEKAARDWLARF